jgi:hypothetical protein
MFIGFLILAAMSGPASTPHGAMAGSVDAPTALWLRSQAPPDRTGRLRIELSPALCGRRPRISVTSGRATRDVAVVPPTCTAEIDVPAAGVHSIKWTASDGSWDEVSEELHAGQVRLLALDDTPYLTGTVSVNRASSSDLAILFQQSGSGTSIAADVGPDGTYRVELPGAGPYSAQLRSRGLLLPGQSQDLLVRLGRNDLDWNVEGGTLSVDLQGWNRTSDVVIRVSRLGAIQHGVTSHGVRLGPEDALPLTFSGLAPATYEVSARLAGGVPIMSDTVAVSLTADAPEARLILELSRARGRVQIVDALQRPIRGARVRAAEGELAEVAPGLFSLDRVARGERLLIVAPGMVPSCKVAVPKEIADDFTVALAEGRQATLRIIGAGPMTSPPGALMWPGVDCPVSTNAFSFRALGPSPRGSVDFLVTNFPAVPVLYLGIGVPEAGIAVEVIDGDAVVRLTR